MRKVGPFLIATLLLAACSPAPEGNDADDRGEASAAADPVKLPMKEFMGHVMQFAGDNVWKWQGSVTDASGERDLRPKTDKDWEDAESASLTLAEVTNMLLTADRRVDDPRWDAAVAKVRDVALREAAAAEKKDYDAYFEIGGELDAACESCHVHFAPGYTAPPELKLAPPPGQKAPPNTAS
ncbi:MAG TPA: hypothetical protein VFF84_04410 [Sphingobium sp.]|nr:hypothetical protein [Sphingobium sp.]